MIFVSLLLTLGCGTDVRPPETYTSVAALKESYAGYPRRITEDMTLRLWVNSSDRFGNFASSLTAQDLTGGIEIKVEGEELFRRFPMRSQITVRCQGLWLGASGGGLCLGATPESDYSTDLIPEERIPMHIKVLGAAPVTAAARICEIGKLDASLVHTLAGFSDVQFIDEELTCNWGTDSAAVVRHIVNRSGDTLDVYVRAQAEFASRPLPAGSGYIEGILNYYAGRYSLRPIKYKDAEMGNARF